MLINLNEDKLENYKGLNVWDINYLENTNKLRRKNLNV